MIVGKVIEIWLYPVKSMTGGELAECRVGERGIPGDRGWALRDEEAGEIRGGKKFPSLLQCSARYLREPDGGATPPAEITLPDGTRIQSDDPKASERLSGLIGKRVTLWPIRPAEDTEHYRRRVPLKEAELRAILGRLPEEPLPDLATFPQDVLKEILDFASPRGTYFDAFPLHLLTTAWLDDLARANPGARFDRRRFRPNFLIDAQRASGKVELDWCGREMRVGDVRVKVEMPVVRCSMTTQPQGDLPKDPSVLRTIVKESDQNVGAYASVLGAGTVRVGDPVELV
jgi:MOSC domain-containing protein